ncbi:TetR/AcrR family transcriptional regulator [Cellulophaga sp. L1A9]|uniref:TetR/AcrR family transcriptional regulator n=1 Tax=Cellulophaga sp. L1A9 TaxID=2686362 RepID=UPI00131AF5B9|nr:TetR/AcrR family transcriptional regulator [Cellulophaga sp. L1A9]
MKKLELRNHIIKVASDLFYSKGYNATGINEIIENAHIAKATLYNHFKSKEELCIEYLKDMNSKFMQELALFIETQDNVRLKLLGIFDYLRELYRASNFNGCWACKCISEIGKENKTIREEIQHQKNNLLQFLKDLVQKNIPQNSNAESERLSNAIYLLYESAISESYLHQNDWPIYSAKSIANQMITNNN